MLIDVGGLTCHPIDWDEQTGDMLVEKFRVMAVGPLLTIKHFLPKLELAPGAKVVNISSGYRSISSTSLSWLSAGDCNLRSHLSLTRRQLDWYLHGISRCQSRLEPRRRHHGPQVGERGPQGHHDLR